MVCSCNYWDNPDLLGRIDHTRLSLISVLVSSVVSKSHLKDTVGECRQAETSVVILCSLNALVGSCSLAPITSGSTRLRTRQHEKQRKRLRKCRATSVMEILLTKN